MGVIVTVHGTSAGDDADEGEKWWQRNSSFQKRLFSWLKFDDAELRVEPFHWEEGPNSEIARRRAGSKLLKQLRQYEKDGDDYYLVGHSHGGSVIHHALLEASGRGLNLPHLKQWTTIGTPFIWMQRKRFVVQRLGHFGKIGYMLMVATIVSMFIGLPMTYFYGKELTKAAGASMQNPGAPSVETLEKSGFLDAQLAMQMLAIPIGALLLFYLLRWSRWRLRRRYAAKTQSFFKNQFVERWFALHSRDDEAINALRAARPLKVGIFQRGLLTEPVKNTVVYSIMIVYGGIIAWNVVALLLHGVTPAYWEEINRFNPVVALGFFPTPDFSKVTVNPIDFRAVFSVPPILLIGFVVAVLLVLPIFMGLFWLLFWVAFSILHAIAYVIGIPVSWFLNNLTSSRLRNSAFGNDTIGEHVIDVRPIPQQCVNEALSVPEPVEIALRSHAERHASLAMARARQVLGMSSELTSGGDITQTLADQLTGHELIHTAYFELDDFAKLIAVGLHTAGAAALSQPFQENEDCGTLIDWVGQNKQCAAHRSEML